MAAVARERGPGLRNLPFTDGEGLGSPTERRQGWAAGDDGTLGMSGSSEVFLEGCRQPRGSKGWLRGQSAGIQSQVLFLLQFWTGNIDLDVCDLGIDILPLAQFLLA